jgi:hypothetical protein
MAWNAALAAFRAPCLCPAASCKQPDSCQKTYLFSACLLPVSEQDVSSRFTVFLFFANQKHLSKISISPFFRPVCRIRSSCLPLPAALVQCFGGLEGIVQGA